jgi:hypothetical protein
MEIHIEEVASTVHTVDDNALLSPSVLRQIVNIVMKQVREENAHMQRVRAEQSVNAGRTEYEYSR